MPRTRPPINKKDLPIGYQMLIPECGYPIHSSIKSKYKLKWMCQKCGHEIDLSIDNIAASPKRKCACISCEKGDNLKIKLKEKNDALEIISWEYDKQATVLKHQSIPGHAIIYTLKCRVLSHNSYTIKGGSLEAYIYSNKCANNIACPQCTELQSLEEKEEELKSLIKVAGIIIADVRKLWPDAKVTFYGLDKLRNNSSQVTPMYSLTIPMQPNQKVDRYGAVITKQPQGNEWFRAVVDEQWITERNLKALIKQAKDDMEKFKSHQKRADKFGSTISAIRVLKNGPITVRYNNLLDITSLWVTYLRANEYAWGRTKISQGESFLLATLKVMFPEVRDWSLNSRSIIPRCNLEIDISSTSLRSGGVNFEYQGDDSHRTCSQTMARDIKKRKLCPGLLLIIDKVKYYSAKLFYALVIKALEDSGADDLLRKSSPVDFDKINKLACKLIDRKLTAIGNRLESRLREANPRHKILTPFNKILSGSYYDYICGWCGSDSKAWVKHHLDRAPKGCKICKSRVAQFVK